MDLSIIIVSWNTRELLRECLESVMGGLGRLRAQIIVVDNASEDGSADMVARAFPFVLLQRNDRNVGFAAANNQALATARGRFVLLLNSDTVVRGDVLEQMVRYAERHGEVGVLGCRVLNTDRTLQRTCFRYPTLSRLLATALGLHRVPGLGRLLDERMRHWRRHDERDVDVVTGCCLLARQAAVDEVGPLDEQFFFYGEETDWCRRMRQGGWAVRFAPVGEIIHHGGASAARLDVRRDVLLASSLVRLHAKHGGVGRARLAWGAIALHHALRAVAWTLLSMCPWPDRPARRRRRWHRRVWRRLGEAWPGRRPTAAPVRGAAAEGQEVVAKRAGRDEVVGAGCR